MNSVVCLALIGMNSVVCLALIGMNSVVCLALIASTTVTFQCTEVQCTLSLSVKGAESQVCSSWQWTATGCQL